MTLVSDLTNEWFEIEDSASDVVSIAIEVGLAANTVS